MRRQVHYRYLDDRSATPLTACLLLVAHLNEKMRIKKANDNYLREKV